MTPDFNMPFTLADFEPWPVGEYARRLLTRKHPVHHHDGVWWFEVRPRYCWCLDPFEIPAHGARPAHHRSLLGFQTLVADPSRGNAYFNPMILDDVAGYGLQRLGAFRRNRVRKGIRSLTVRPLNRPDELRADGFEIETEFYSRTQWRAPPPRDEWPEYAELAFVTPTIDHLLGAFADEKLVAYMSWFGIGRTAHLAHIASGEAGNRACANDALLFHWIMMLRESGVYDRAVYTIRSFKPSLDEFKESHLFRLCSIPMRLVLNPLVRAGMRWLKPAHLSRLQGLDDAAARDWIESARRRGVAEPSMPATPSDSTEERS